MAGHAKNPKSNAKYTPKYGRMKWVHIEKQRQKNTDYKKRGMPLTYDVPQPQ